MTSLLEDDFFQYFDGDDFKYDNTQIFTKVNDHDTKNIK